jgi:hypothetical protein
VTLTPKLNCKVVVVLAATISFAIFSGNGIQ